MRSLAFIIFKLDKMIKKIFPVTFAFIVFICFNLDSSALDIESLKSKTYGDIAISGSTFTGKGQLIDFLSLNRGERFSYIEVSMALKKLFRLGLYEDIRIKYELEGEVINLEFVLFEKRVLKNIIITGRNLPFKRKKLLEIMDLYHGKLISGSSIENAVNNLSLFFDNQGIKGSEISYKINLFDNEVILVITIKNAGFKRINRVILKGVNENIESAFQKTGKSIQGRIISERAINDVEYSISSLLVSRGYRESRILSRDIINISDNKADIVFNIALNNRFAVEINGNKDFSDNEIMENVPQLVDFINNPEETEFIEGMLDKFYKDRGYFQAESKIGVKELKKDFYVLQIDIDEGRRYRIRDLLVWVDGRIQKLFDQYLLLAPVSLYSYPLYEKEKLDKDINTIRNYFIDKGYLDVEADHSISFIDNINQLILNINVSMNDQYHVSDITVTGDIMQEHKSFYESLAAKYKSRPYSPAILSELMDSIYHYYLTNGYIDFEAKAIVNDDDDHTKSINLDIYEGKPYSIGNIIYAGNLKTSGKILTRNFQMQDGLPYDTSLLFILRQQLYSSGYFKRVNIEEYDYFTSIFRKDFIVHLEETDFGNAFFSVGYDTKERLRTQVEFSYLNITGYGTDLSVGLKVSSIEERYNIRFSNRYLVRDTNVIFDIFNESLERNIKNEEIKGTSLTFSRQIQNTGFKIDFGYEFKDIHSFEKNFKSSVIGSLSATLIYDSRDNILFPSRGGFFFGNLKYADSFLYSDNDFVRTFFKGTRYFPVSRHVFVVSLQNGFNFPLYDEKRVPYSERYFLGGRLTMRGYERNSIAPDFFGEPFGGNAMFLLNAELRLDIAYGFGITLFFDTGNVWEHNEDFDFEDLRADAGFGIFYNTPVGPVRLDIGFKLSSEPGERTSEYFFNFGHPF